ncbi:MAG: hypothetical protein OXI35_16325 [Gemmatimonadota bacterium]|nr:hypothetical protein [Gemmatimonadota bacterium]
MKVLQIALGHSKVGVVATLASINPVALTAIGLGAVVVGATAGIMLYRLELEKAKQIKHRPINLD